MTAVCLRTSKLRHSLACLQRLMPRGRLPLLAIAALSAALLLLLRVMASSSSSSSSSPPLFEGEAGVLASQARFTRYRSKSLTVRALIDALSSGSGPVCEELTSLLRESPYKAFFFESRPFTAVTADTQAYEFVLVETSFFDEGGGAGEVDLETFRGHFVPCAEYGAVGFSSLGGDAQLVAPCPSHEDKAAYAHLAAFARRAPAQQQRALWSRTAEELRSLLSSSRGGEPLWLSTSGKGVAYLHVRVDSRPKYYTFPEYKVFASVD